MKLSYQTYSFHDFSGQDLRKLNLSHSKFLSCKFDDCNMEWADCTHSVFMGSSFKNTNCRYTNFAFSNLQDTYFYPKDAYGATFTMECKTWKGMKISKLWWFSYHFFTMLMVPELDKGLDPRDKLIVALGKERFTRLSQLFARRGM